VGSSQKNNIVKVTMEMKEGRKIMQLKYREKTERGGLRLGTTPWRMRYSRSVIRFSTSRSWKGGKKGGGGAKKTMNIPSKAHLSRGRRVGTSTKP